MQYPEVVSTVHSLLPEMATSPEPGDVLVKYASANNLTPAVLERMCQVYNQGAALQGMLGPDRGASVPLIDSEATLRKYAAWEPKKAYAAPPAPARRTHVPNVTAMLLGQAAPEADFSDPDDVTKAASAPVLEEEDPDYSADEWQALTDNAVSLLDKSASALGAVLREQGLIEAGRGGSVDCRAAEADAIRARGDMGKAAFDWFSNWTAKRWGIPCLRAEDALVGQYKLAADWSGALTEATLLVDCYDTLVKCAAKVEKKKQRKAPQTGGSPGDQGAPRNPPQEGGTPGTPGKEQREPAQPGGSSGRQPDKYEQTYVYGPAEKPKSEGKQETPIADGVSEIAKRVAGLLSKPTDRLAGHLDSWMNTPRENKAQRRVDTGVASVMQENNLMRLRLVDPVISKADPEEVAAIFETIRRGSDDVANDINLLRFQMREALQYGGVPPEGYKQLLSIAELRDGHTKSVRGEEQARYGGGKPRERA